MEFPRLLLCLKTLVKAQWVIDVGKGEYLPGYKKDSKAPKLESRHTGMLEMPESNHHMISRLWHGQNGQAKYPKLALRQSD
jgi:hypothetical protein